MNPLLALGLGIAAALSYFCYDRLAEPWNFITPPALVAATVIALGERGRRGIRIGGMNWTEAELCQHFFISGATGSSKTQSAINTLAATFLGSFPRCSAIFLDVKGVVHRDVDGLAKWAGRGRRPGRERRAAIPRSLFPQSADARPLTLSRRGRLTKGEIKYASAPGDRRGVKSGSL
jgi:hypothetical protein